MSKHLILFRHGKSDWDATFGKDHERPVAKRGIKAATLMGQILTAAGQLPDAIVTSSAVRARTTAETAAAAGSWSAPITITEELYEATPSQVLTVIQQQPDTVETLMLVGHEPTFSEVTTRLMGGGSLKFPTAAMVRIDFSTDQWQTVAFGTGTLMWLMPPKFFTEGAFKGVF